jgi:hypothetical protein
MKVMPDNAVQNLELILVNEMRILQEEMQALKHSVSYWKSNTRQRQNFGEMQEARGIKYCEGGPM